MASNIARQRSTISYDGPYDLAKRCLYSGKRLRGIEDRHLVCELIRHLVYLARSRDDGFVSVTRLSRRGELGPILAS